MITYKEFDLSLLCEVKEIYTRQQWNSYLNNDAKLKAAFENSLYLYGAFEEEDLVGFVRCVGDGEHIVLVHDLIVRPEYQRRGIGTALFQAVWDKYIDVRMFHVLTDMEDEVDNYFYQSFGMKKLEEGHMVGYFR